MRSWPLVLTLATAPLGCAATAEMTPVLPPDQPHTTIPYSGVREEQFPDYGAIRADVLSAEGRAAAKGGQP